MIGRIISTAGSCVGGWKLKRVVRRDSANKDMLLALQLPREKRIRK
jgi:hypothetical protein